MRVQVFRSIAQIESIADSWRRLAEGAGYALSDPAWHLNAARYTHSADEEPHVIALWRGDALAGVAPLIHARTPAGSRYEIIGSRVLYEPAEIIATDDEAAMGMADALARLDRPVFLSRLPSLSAFARTFEPRFRSRGVVLSPASSGSPFIDLARGWEPFHAQLPSRVRNIIRRAERALGKLGDLEMQFVRPQPSTAARVLTEAFQVELHSWKGRAGSAVLQRQDLREFFLHYGPEIAGRGELLVAFLRFNGSAIASHVASVARGGYRQLKIGYDDRYAKYLPGLQLLLQTIRWSFEQNLATYEFMGAQEPWIEEWTDEVRSHKSILFYPFSVRGLAGLAQDGLGRVRRKVIALVRSGRRPGRLDQPSPDRSGQTVAAARARPCRQSSPPKA